MSTLAEKQARYAAVQYILKTVEPDIDLFANVLFRRMKARKSPITGATIPLSNGLTLPAVKNILIQIPPEALEAIVVKTPFDRTLDPKTHFHYPPSGCNAPGIYVATFLNHDGTVLSRQQIQMLSDVLCNSVALQAMIAPRVLARDTNKGAIQLGQVWKTDLAASTSNSQFPYIPCYAGYSDHPMTRKSQHSRGTISILCR